MGFCWIVREYHYYGFRVNMEAHQTREVCDNDSAILTDKCTKHIDKSVPTSQRRWTAWDNEPGGQDEGAETVGL